jgi:hypothetical protein
MIVMQMDQASIDRSAIVQAMYKMCYRILICDWFDRNQPS